MCLDCGCGAAHDDMGAPDVHLTDERLRKAAEATGQSVSQVLETIRRTAEKDREAHPEEH